MKLLIEKTSNGYLVTENKEAPGYGFANLPTSVILKEVKHVFTSLSELQKWLEERLK